MEEDAARIQDENYEYLGQPDRNKADGIDDVALEDRMMELDKLQIKLEPSATNNPVIFKPKKVALDGRDFDNIRKRGADREAKYGSFQFDFDDKRLSQSSVADIHLLTDATLSFSRVLFTTNSLKRQNDQTVSNLLQILINQS